MRFFAYFIPLKSSTGSSTTGDGTATQDPGDIAAPSTDSSPLSPTVSLPERPTAAQSVPNLATTSSALAPENSPNRKPKRRTTLLRRPFILAPVDEGDIHEASAPAQNYSKRMNSTPLKLSPPRLLSSSDKRAKESATVVRSLILGPPSSSDPKVSKAVAIPQISKVKTQLMQPKSANKVISHLRRLSVQDQEESGQSTRPIHAVCLSHTDEEEEILHFQQLAVDPTEPSSFADIPCVLNASAEKLAQIFNDMQLVDFLLTPDMGLGQPGDEAGILAGSVPTAETVLEGIRIITPALMELGYTTGKALLPDHAGVHPPTDRISVLTYWWGLEVLLPPPTLIHLAKAKSISSSVVNFLSALAMVNNGVREILPFVRYISQFIDFEFQAINKQNKGRGVVCAATWIMPAAMMPRPWDFDPAPSPAIEPVIEKPSIPIADEPAQSSPPVADAISFEVIPPTPLHSVITPAAIAVAAAA